MIKYQNKNEKFFIKNSIEKFDLNFAPINFIFINAEKKRIIKKPNYPQKPKKGLPKTKELPKAKENKTVLIKETKTPNFTFYCTGIGKEMLMNGMKVYLETSMTPNECRSSLLKSLEGKYDIKNKQLLLYLPVGIPFFVGTLDDLFTNSKSEIRKFIYGVLTNPVPDKILNKRYYELCDISDPDLKMLISPHCESTDRSLSDMACLLGYLNHDGDQSDLFLRTCAAIIHSPPLVSSMKKIMVHNDITGRDIITVCSTFFTFFRAFLPSSIPDKKVFENSFNICDLILNVEFPPSSISLIDIEVKKDDLSTRYFTNFGLNSLIHFWKWEAKEPYYFQSFEYSPDFIMENKSFTNSLRPKKPLLILF